jgi:hypothetical protein
MPDWMPGSCRVWLHDGSPAGDVAGRDVVGGASEPAPLAGKPVPAGTVGLVNVPALRAFPRGVPRVHLTISSYGRVSMVTRRAGSLPIVKDWVSARDLG